MIYVALLRGVNVGGKAAVNMAALKACFEQLELTDVKTYINSGNVIFRTEQGDRAELTKRIEAAIEKQFDLPIQVLFKTHQEFKDLVAKIPADWVNNSDTKCDVLFLWPEVDKPEILADLPSKPEVDKVRYLPGAVLWHIDRGLYSKSRMNKIVGTPTYKKLTIRNINTTRKLLSLMDALA